MKDKLYSSTTGMNNLNANGSIEALSSNGNHNPFLAKINLAQH